MSKKICVYTCITGNYDNLHEIKNVEKDIDYYCFTNNKNIESKTWKVVYIENNGLNNIELARKIKILGDPIINEYEIVLWMDAAVTFDISIRKFINMYLTENSSFVCFKHGERKNIKEEAKACVRFKKETKEKIDKLLDFYKNEGYKDNNGLIESTVLIKRPNDSKVKETMKIWFDMIVNYSTRDQLSFNYAIFVSGLKPKWINKKVFDNEYFTWNGHNNSSEKYSIYFGDNTYEYDEKLDRTSNYEIIDGKYIIKETVPCNTDVVIIGFTEIPCTELKSITGISKNYISFANNFIYKKKNIFYSTPGYVILKKKFVKNEKIKLILDYRKLEEEEKEKIIVYLKNENEKYFQQNSQLLQERDELKKQIERIYNSKAWKLVKFIRKMCFIKRK